MYVHVSLDSSNDLPEKGILDAFDSIVAALLTEIFFRDFVLGS
jgi:hypothetical protein